MDKLRNFEDFVAENYSTQDSANTTNSILKFIYEAESGDFTLALNEGFVQDLQKHIRQTIDSLIKDHGIKSAKIDKFLEPNLEEIITSFKAGETPAETAAKIA